MHYARTGVRGVKPLNLGKGALVSDQTGSMRGRKLSLVLGETFPLQLTLN